MATISLTLALSSLLPSKLSKMVGLCSLREKSNKVNDAAVLQYECLLFDLDDTLYPLSMGILEACGRNIQEYMVKNLGFDAESVKVVSPKFYREHGTTLAGLVAAGYEIDYDEYHSFVHGRLPYHNLKPDPVLKNLLLSLPQKKFVFTNSDIRHTIKVLKVLGLEDCFNGIICFETLMGFIGVVNVKESYELGYRPEYPSTKNSSVNAQMKASEKNLVLCKPSLQAMNRAIKLVGADPNKTVFFDDSTRNIASGKNVGLHTVLVGSSDKVEGADYAIMSIHNIREAIPGLWGYKQKIMPTMSFWKQCPLRKPMSCITR